MLVATANNTTAIIIFLTPDDEPRLQAHPHVTVLFSSTSSLLLLDTYAQRLCATTLCLFVCQAVIHLEQKLSYRRGTARRAMLVNSCYVSRGMGVIKVSNSKSDKKTRR